MTQARSLPKVRPETAAMVGVLVVGGWVAWRIRRGLPLLPAIIGETLGGVVGRVAAGYAETGEVARELADAPATQTPTAFESAVGTVTRSLGGDSPPEVTSRPDVPADPAHSGPFLGQPRNLLFVAGKVRFPVTGATLGTKLGADTFDVDAALENQSSEPRTGELVVSVREKNILGNWGESSVSGGKVTLAPREFRQVMVRAPNVVGRPVSPLVTEVRLRFAGYTLDLVSFRRTYSLL